MTSHGPGVYLDAHLHYWDPRRLSYPWLSAVPSLNRPFLPGDLCRQVDGLKWGPPAGVVGVEADREPGQAAQEVHFLRSLDGEPAPVLGVVAHVPLERGNDCARLLDQVTAVPFVVGIRRLLQDEAAGFTSDPRFLRGMELLGVTGRVFDLCIRQHQLAEVTDLVARNPQIAFVLDHLGKPEVSAASRRSWATDLARLAALPNVRCKLSGLATEADRDHRKASDLLPFLTEAIDAFGPSRCMFGSDWPVLTQAMSYGHWVALVARAVDDLPDHERDAVFRRTAISTYGVTPALRNSRPGRPGRADLGGGATATTDRRRGT